MPPAPRRWSRAMAEALYGPGGFYRRERPAGHFRTSAHSAVFAAAIRRLADEVDAALGRPDPFDVVDVGSGGGELLAAMSAGAPVRWRLTGVEIGDPLPGVTGLAVANEWLDNVPCDVVQRCGGGLRYVLEDGSPGDPVDAADAAWLQEWWPLDRPGDRAEVGLPRDRAWRALVDRVRGGVAVAVDYSHDRADRPRDGTLTGYRAGRQVPPIADGSCDLTAHVALDACAKATGGLLISQRAALGALGVRASRPAYGGDPLGYLRALDCAGQAAELLDPAGLGGFGWLVVARGCDLPASLRVPA